MITTEFFIDTLPHIMFLSVLYSCGVLCHNETVFAVPKKIPKWVPPVSNLWNFGMCAFSTIGSYYTWPIFVNLLKNEPIEARNIWFILYALSKPLELIDTFFLIQKSKQVGTLHWTHHAVTMLYVWYIACHNESVPPQLFAMFCIINYFVHALMYGYYVVMDFVTLPKNVSGFVTSCQISQFVICIIWTFLWRKQTPTNVFCMTILMYFYYFAMFMKFFLAKHFNRVKCHFCKTRMSVKTFCTECNMVCCKDCILKSNVCDFCCALKSE